MKKCKKCCDTKSLDQFYDKGKYKDCYCKSCKFELMKAQLDKDSKLPKKECTSCKKSFKASAFKKRDGKFSEQCTRCSNKMLPKSKPIKPKKTKDDRKLESIFESEHRLKKQAKKISFDNVEVEKEKIKNGYSWVNDVINRGTALESKVRVLRKKQSA